MPVPMDAFYQGQEFLYDLVKTLSTPGSSRGWQSAAHPAPHAGYLDYLESAQILAKSIRQRAVEF
jgi:hypothetical protein